MADTILSFHPRCGKYVQVIEGGMKVERTNNISKQYGGALTARPLETEEVFTLELTACEFSFLAFGITTHNPEELLEFPQLMRKHSGTWVLLCGEEGWIFVNKKLVNMNFLSEAIVASLKNGGTLGLQVRVDRKLCFYVNGKDVGVAATDIPDTVYGFVDLPNPWSPTVKLIPDAQMVLKVREISYSELEFGPSLGEGGQGAVWKGEWKSRGLTVAIKNVLHNIRDEEAEILSRIHHKNVMKFYGICTEKRPAYLIVTEFAEGGSLYDLIHKKHYHPEQEEGLRWAKEIAEGMNYLHQQKIMHRDLKSPNVLLTANKTIKLCDFGSAKDFDHTAVQSKLIVTYRWTAPEVLKREKVSLSCDVFSYGMVLLEIFQLDVPFADVTTGKAEQLIMDGKTPAIPQFLTST